MTLQRWDPLRDLLNFQERASRLLCSSSEDERSKNRARWCPVVDILETPDAYIFIAELPGVGRDNINVEVQGNTLTLSGERFIGSAPEIAVFHRIERVHGVFERSFTLPGQVNVAMVEAKYADGILEVILPKVADSERCVSIVCSG